MSIHKLSFALVLSSSVMLCGQLAAQSGTTQEVPATAAPQVAQPATAAPQVAQPAAAEQKPAEPAAPADLAPDALKDKCGMVMGYNLARNWKSQNPDADFNQVLEGIRAADGGEDKSSYVFGYQMMSRMKDQKVGLKASQLEVGLRKAMAGEELGMTDQEVQMLMMAFGKMVEEKRTAERNKTIADNTAAGEAYIAAQKAANPNLKELSEGIYYEVLTEGSGPKPGKTATVSVNYTGTFIDGEVFDSSVKPTDGGAGKPAEFRVNRVIPGFTKSLLAMPVGSKWRVIIPGDQAYGTRGSGGKIGPMKTLIFELELLKIVNDGVKPAAVARTKPKAPAKPTAMTPAMRKAIETQMKAAIEAQKENMTPEKRAAIEAQMEKAFDTVKEKAADKAAGAVEKAAGAVEKAAGKE